LQTNANAWQVFGSGLPNVRVEDIEISYTKKQLFAATYGRGVWIINLTESTMPLHSLDFTYVKNANNYSLKWKIADDEIRITSLEKKYDNTPFKEISSFTGVDRKVQPGYIVPKEKENVYYRLNYTKPTGQKIYSQIIAIRPAGSANAITVYPNPSSENIYVSSANKMQSVRIITTSGQQLSYAKPQSNFYSFYLGVLPKGNYIIQVTDEKGNTSQEKIIRN
jgi:hypothetical protein